MRQPLSGFVPPPFVPPQPVLDYRARPYVERGTSKFAVCWLVLSLLTSLFVVAPKVLGFGTPAFLFAFATFWAVVAVARVRNSRGALRPAVGWVALAIPLAWWVLYVVLMALFMLMAASGGWQD